MEPFKPYSSPAELKAAQAYRGDSGPMSVLFGFSFVTFGGSIAVLAGEKHPKVLHSGQVIWAAGVALIAAGAKSWRDGEYHTSPPLQP
jgi:hypothetical protein